MFANLQAFRDRLEQTLRRALADLPPPIPPGTPLAELIVAVGPAVRACFQDVTMIANCKAIHDHLHELRQKVIRPVREEVLSVWQEDGTLTRGRERLLLQHLRTMSGQLGAIRVARKSIGPQHQGLRDSVDRVLGTPELWNPLEPEPDFRQAREPFTERFDAFAEDVQNAFSEADRSMTREESDLREHYHKLRDQLERGRRESGLGRLDQQRLDEELKTVDANRSHVKKTLEVHHCWQEAHDKLEDVNGFRDSDLIERRLRSFKGTPLQNILALANQELDSPGAANSDASGDVAVIERTTAAVATDGLEEHLRALRTKLKALEADPSLHQFDEMRKPFDDAFYRIDQRTKEEVDRARERVDAIARWFDAISAASRQSV